MRSLLKRFWKRREAQDVVEYALLLALICTMTAGLYVSLPATMGKIWSHTTNNLDQAAQSADGHSGL